MKSIIKLQIESFHGRMDILIFKIRMKLFGFENANKMLWTLDKRSLLPILRRNGAKIGTHCDFESPVIFHNCSNYENLTIGDNCHIGKNCFFDLRDKINIDSNVVISMQCTFITHIDMAQSALSSIFPAMHSPVNIHRNVYVGANSIILKGVVLGQNSLLAAGSVITKDVAPNTMVGGVPSKIIKKINPLYKQHNPL